MYKIDRRWAKNRILGQTHYFYIIVVSLAADAIKEILELNPFLTF